MTTTFRPVPGQVALLEPGSVTGLVGRSDDDSIEVDLGLTAARVEEHEVVVSVCAPDALYRLRATATPGRDRGIVVLSEIKELERIQRRTAARIPIRLGVSLATFDDPAAEIRSVTGFTIDIGVGGLQVQTLRPLPDGDLTVLLTLPDGTSVVALTQALQTVAHGDAFRSRLAFQDLPADAMTALSELVEANQHLACA